MDQRPLIVQSDKTILLATDSAVYHEIRDFVARFAELERSPEHFHTYRISPVSLWNAASAGTTPRDILQGLMAYSRYPVPPNIAVEIEEQMSRYGSLQLVRRGTELVLSSPDGALLRRVARNPSLSKVLADRVDDGFAVPVLMRGKLKVVLLKLGWPVEDLAGYTPGTPLTMGLRERTLAGVPFSLRGYQRDAAEVFHAGGSERGGSGVIVLPCGSGKTMVGMGAMAQLQRHTLILTTGISAARQWLRELRDKTTLKDEEMGEYTGLKKEVRPVTVTTYQTLSFRKKKTEPFPHYDLFTTLDWGLIIYDEVHLLPAPIFRIAAEIQARRRLGLTATLVREDGREGEVFSLIGPKRYDVPWKDLERAGWIAGALCYEIRLDLPADEEEDYFAHAPRRQLRIASSNPAKDEVVKRLLDRHRNDKVLIIGFYLDQLRRISVRYDLPLILGDTAQGKRDALYDAFRRGEVRCLVVSKVGNFAIDLPEANVAIQVSGTFGSRQEEAQRLGRILRPKQDGSSARFYTLITRRTADEEFAANRQLFLTEQGYRYYIVRAEELDLLDELP
ncbi:DEAD/DEAH box helicase [Candidatus Fermentibacteria bacterium]|nr:DEAD/DEAH box helicase [Candidatus Fermentibacteria bacterium]